MTGIELIVAERKRQIKEEGWTAEHDEQHDDESLALAAIHYAMPHQYYCPLLDLWPYSWDRTWDKAGDDRIRDLTKAGALIAAEIDRLSASWQTVNKINPRKPGR